MASEKNKKRIAYVSTLKGSPWGGSEELWHLSAIHAMDVGGEIGIFVYDWNELPAKLEQLKSEGAKIFKRPKFPSLLHRVFRKMLGLLGISHPMRLNPYADLLKFKPDVVVVTDGATYYTANDPWLSRILKAHFSGQYVVVCQGNTPYHIPDNRDEAIDLFLSAKKVVFVSEGNRQDCFHQLRRQLGNSMVIQNPINLSKIEALPMQSTSDTTIRFAMVGRLEIADKCQDKVIAMMSNPFWKDADISIHIYGAGPDKEYLSELIKYYGVEEKVSLEGYADPISIYEKCHGMIMLSRLEGTSLAMLEAMALGRLCIVSNVGGSAEWIVDAENGYLVEAPTGALLDKKLRVAIENTDQWPEMGLRAFQRIKDNRDPFPGQTLFNTL